MIINSSNDNSSSCDDNNIFKCVIDTTSYCKPKLPCDYNLNVTNSINHEKSFYGDQSDVNKSIDSSIMSESEQQNVTISCDSSCNDPILISNDNFTNNDNSMEFKCTISSNNQPTISCMAINVGGLKSKLDFPSFITFVKNHDVIVITESKFADTDSIHIDGYTPFYKNRNKFRRKSG